MSHVAAAYLWQNGLTMVFDHGGEQIPELQGRHTAELEQRIRERSDERTVFFGFAGERCNWHRLTAAAEEALTLEDLDRLDGIAGDEPEGP